LTYSTVRVIFAKETCQWIFSFDNEFSIQQISGKLILKPQLSVTLVQPIPFEMTFSEALFQSSKQKLGGLFCHVSVERDPRAWALSFEKIFGQSHFKWDTMYKPGSRSRPSNLSKCGDLFSKGSHNNRALFANREKTNRSFKKNEGPFFAPADGSNLN